MSDATIERRKLLQFALDQDRDHEAREVLYGAIEEHEADTEQGAPVGAAVQTAIESGDDSMHVWRVSLALYDLLSRGEVYAPHRTTLRTLDLEERDDDTDVATDGGATVPNPWREDGPTECPHDPPTDHELDEYDWWLHGDEMYVRGWQFDATCQECGTGELDDLVEGNGFYFTCDCTYTYEVPDGTEYERSHSLEIAPTDGDVTEWWYHGTEGVEADVTGEDDRLVVEFDAKGRTHVWHVESDLLGGDGQ